MLDIGCGWGGLGLYLAEFCRAQVTGITLSEEQLAIAKQRAGEKNLTDTLDFRLQDYRAVDRDVRPDRLGRHVRARGA